MSESIAAHAEGSFREHRDVITSSARPAYQAYHILHITFAVPENPTRWSADTWREASALPRWQETIH